MLTVTIYTPPNGRSAQHEITHVYPDDATWFNENCVKVSMETLRDGEYVVYGELPEPDEEGDPIELTVLAAGRNCEETLAELRKLCQAELEKP